MKNKPYPLYDIPQVHTLRELVENGRKNGEFVTAFYRGKNNDQPVTFGNCSRIIEALGTYLLSLGLHSSHIAIIGENSTEWVLSFLAITNSGNAVVPLDRLLPCEDLAELVLHSDCKAIIYSDKSKKTIEFLQGLKKPYKAIKYIPLSEFDRYVADGERLIENGNTQFKSVGKTIDKDTLATIVYTSGTTGKMKGVMLSHGNLASDTVGACQNAIAENAQLLLPLHHTFAWSSQMLAAFIYIRDLHISGNLKHILRDFQRNCPQNVAAVPLMVDMLYKAIWDTANSNNSAKKLNRAIRLSRFLMYFGIDVKRRLFRRVHRNFGDKLSLIICGGAALDTETEKGLYDIGIQVLTGYGITECSPIVTVNRNNYYKFGSVGLPLPCNRIKIDHPDANGIGEIMVAGSNVMLGYYKDPQATKEAFDGEWFKTGDYGRIDKDGFLFITGRKKNLIILSNGENVMPEELEMKLGRLEYVVDVICYEENGKITAEFYLDEEHFPDARNRLTEDIAKFNRSMPPQKNIHGVKIRDIPFEKTTTMKIKRYLTK